MKRFLPLLAAALVAIALLTPRAEAQVQFMPYLGYDFDVGGGSLLIGVGAEFDFLPAGAVMLALRPSAEYYFVDGIDFFQLNADAIAQLGGLAPNIGIFGGGGLGIGFASVDVGDSSASSTSVGLNLLGGLEFGGGFTTPFVQGRLTLMDGTRFGLQGGVKLNL